MRIFNLILVIIILCGWDSNLYAQTVIEQNLSINASGTANDASAILDINSTNQGILIPRMSAADRLSISSPAEGLMVYDTDAGSFYYFNGISWINIAQVAGLIHDLDQDTRIETEYAPADNKIRVFLNDEERLRLDTNSFGDLLIENTDPRDRYNLFIGEQTGKENGKTASNATHGKRNTAVGDSTFLKNRRGRENSALGFQALSNNNSGQFNTAIGSRSLSANSLGNFNAAVGYRAMLDNINGHSNTSIGSNTMVRNQSGSNNVAIGLSSLFNSKSGSYTVAIGSRAAIYDTLSNRNVYIGYEAGGGDGVANKHAKSGNVFIGYQAGKLEKGSNQLYIDNSATSTPLIRGDFAADSVIVNGQLEVKEEIVIGSSNSTNPAAGTIRWNDATSDFEGFNGTEWLSLTCCTGSGGVPPVSDTAACRVTGSVLDSAASFTAPNVIPDGDFGYEAAISGDYAGATSVVVPTVEDEVHFYKRVNNSWTQDTSFTYGLGVGDQAVGITALHMDQEYAALEDWTFDGNYSIGGIDLYKKGNDGWSKTDELLGGLDIIRNIFSLSGSYLLEELDIAFTGELFINTYYISDLGEFNFTSLNFPLDSSFNADLLCDLSRCGETMIIGAKYDTINSNLRAGRVYLMDRISDTVWNFNSSFSSPDLQTDQLFGKSVSVSGDWISIASGNSSIAGKVYLYQKSGGTWNYFGAVQKPGTMASDQYARWIKLVGHKLVVSSRAGGQDRYLVYEYDGTDWLEISDNTMPANSDWFDVIDFDGWNVLTGAPGEGVSGDTNAGRVYVSPID